MIRSFSEIDDNLFDAICQSFEQNYDFNLLKENFPDLDHNVLFSVLFSTRLYADKIFSNIYQEKIDEPKIIIISDTHYGSINENMTYTNDVFEFARDNGIHTILHGGDIIESDISNKNRYNNIKQADYFINYYPHDDNIKTYALLGNHDYWAISENEEIRDVLSSRDDINILGYKKVYLKWVKKIISLQHNIKNFRLFLPVYSEVLAFKGHSHVNHVREKKKKISERIYIPTLSDDITGFVDKSINGTNDWMKKPGFLVAQIIDNDVIYVTTYSFTKGKITEEKGFQKALRKNTFKD